MKTIQTDQKAYTTTYAVAASWAGCTTILCNEIAYLDEELMYYNTIGYECDEETEEHPEIFQYYLTNCSEDFARFLNEHFGLMFAYSEKLGLWVLLVDHFGTSWDYVTVDTDLHTAAAPLGTRRIN
jgi:lipoprotein